MIRPIFRLAVQFWAAKAQRAGPMRERRNWSANSRRRSGRSKEIRWTLLSCPVVFYRQIEWIWLMLDICVLRR